MVGDNADYFRMMDWNGMILMEMVVVTILTGTFTIVMNGKIRMEMGLETMPMCIQMIREEVLKVICWSRASNSSWLSSCFCQR